MQFKAKTPPEGGVLLLETINLHISLVYLALEHLFAQIQTEIQTERQDFVARFQKMPYLTNRI